MPDIFDKYSHAQSDSNPTIYVYEDTNPIYKGMLKVGYTKRAVITRVEEQYPTLRPDVGDPFEILYHESALYPDGGNFIDDDVHEALRKRGFPPLKDKNGKDTEFFKCSLDDVKAAIVAVKNHTANVENRTKTFGLRPEQKEAIEKTEQYFVLEIETHPGHTPKFLWNCKMRFGKTFAAYKLAQSMKLKRVLVLTFKPAVEDSWEEDLITHLDFEGWQFYSTKTEKDNSLKPEDLDQNRPIVCFGSFQDYLGTNESGGIKAKNEWVHTTNWDLVVFDEYHFGAWRDNAKSLFQKDDEDAYDTLDIEKYEKEEADNAYNETFLPITTDYYLFLSGTPFKALNNGEFVEDQIFSWTYSDEQQAKEEWPNLSRFPDYTPAQGETNPYESLPRMVLLTYRMPDDIRSIAYNSETNEFDLNQFFKAEIPEGGKLEDAQFILKSSVQKWLDLIRGSYRPTTIDEAKTGNATKPVMPYSDVRLQTILLHTLWFLPNVASCYAMANLLAEPQNVFYKDYKVNVCAGISAGVGIKAVPPVRNSMSPALETKTITLSCGKLTTGITIKPWTGIFMLRNLSSPETYFQAAFRVQSPWTFDDPINGTEIIKQDCYVFDFAIERALRQISEYGAGLSANKTANPEKNISPEKAVAELVNFLPVLAYDGSGMVPISASEILDLTMSGTTATLLAKRWESAVLVNVDNETLQRILDNPRALEALANIEGFRTLNKDIEAIINKSNAVKKAKKENKKSNPEQKKALDEAEKEYKRKRKEIQEKLIKFATRIPIFMYLTDYREESLKDVITQLEPALFRKVTGLTIEDFNLLVSIGVFNESKMNEAVWHFKRYEDSSLEYTGINKHDKDMNVGLFSTSITKEDYEHWDELQNASLASKAKRAARIEAQKTGKPVAKETLETETAVVKESKKIEATKHDVDLSKIVVGQKVSHTRFGEGTITVVTPQSNGTIMIKTVFKEGGEKDFVAPLAFDRGTLTLYES